MKYKIKNEGDIRTLCSILARNGYKVFVEEEKAKHNKNIVTLWLNVEDKQ